MIKTKHVITTLPTLAQKLAQLNLEALAIKTGLIVRVTPQFSAEGFLLSLLQCIGLGSGSLRKIAQNLTPIQKKGLSKQAVFYRFKERGEQALLFLEAVSEALMEESQSVKLEHYHFKRVLLQDSSQLRLPKANSKHYRGISNQWGEKSSAKIDLIKDILSDEVINSSIHNGTYQDRNLANDLYDLVEEGDLVLRDMGYFSTAGLEKIQKKKAFYVSRVPNNTGITLMDGSSFETYLKAVPQGQSVIDVIARIKESTPLKVRIVAIRCPEEVTTQRRAKVKAHRKKMGNKKTMYSIEREGWTVYVTNLDSDSFSAEIIYQIYAQRWGIEIQFRALKSQTDLHGFFNKRVKYKIHLEILMQAVMILAQLTAKIHYSLKKSLSKQDGANLSVEKISSWLVSTILQIKNFRDPIDYDLRHLSQGKKPKKPHMKLKAISLF